MEAVLKSVQTCGGGVQSCCGGLRDKIKGGIDRMTSKRDEDESWKERDDPTGIRVVLHVYNVQKRLGGINKGLRAIVGGGAFHGGVVVYFEGDYPPVEFSFGFAPEGETGVFFVKPKGVHPDPFDFKEALEMGHTPLSHDDILDIIHELQDMKGEWTGPSYNVVRHNCCHFSEEFLKRLKVPRPFPKWVNKMAKLGTKIEDKAHKVFAKAHHVEEKMKKNARHLLNWLSGKKNNNEEKKKEVDPPIPPADDDDTAPPPPPPDDNKDGNVPPPPSKAPKSPPSA